MFILLDILCIDRYAGTAFAFLLIKKRKKTEK